MQTIPCPGRFFAPKSITVLTAVALLISCQGSFGTAEIDTEDEFDVQMPGEYLGRVDAKSRRADIQFEMLAPGTILVNLELSGGSAPQAELTVSGPDGEFLDRVDGGPSVELRLAEQPPGLYTASVQRLKRDASFRMRITFPDCVPIGCPVDACGILADSCGEVLDCGDCAATCGDGRCEDSEDCGSCATDCGACPPNCGDGQCDADEDCGSCATDCGACPPSCGDGQCDADEDCGSCATDCGACPPSCGDGQCDADEDCGSCATDCGVCPPSCGDGQCEDSEDCGSCATDCGVCPPSCGDGQCDAGEGCDSCAADCGICPDGPTVNAASCSQADVTRAISDARAGDTVLVPAGTCTWTTTVSVAVDIDLVGSGTEIRRGAADIMLLSFHSSGNLSGFHFMAGDQSDLWNGDLLWFDSAPRIHHNTFESYTGRWMIKGTTEPGTLIDNNQFIGDADIMHLYGNGDADWAQPVAYGSSQFIFIEDNIFDVTYDSGGQNPAIDFDSGGSVVFRYNFLHNSYFENHDRCRSNLPSARSQEIYGNTFSVDGNKWKGIDLSSGGGVIYDNTFTGDWSIPIGVYRSRDTCSLPALEVPGGYEPLYIWDNLDNGSTTELICTSAAADCAAMTYFNGQAMPGYAAYTYPHPRRGGESSCQPLTCAQLAPECGSLSDGCGGQLQCTCDEVTPSCGDGACDGSESCSSCAADCGVCVGNELPQGNSGIASQYPGDSGIGSHSAVILVDDFESYDLRSDLRGTWTHVYHDTNIRIASESDTVFAGGQALEFTLPNSTSEVSNTLEKELAVEQDVLFVRYYIRYDPNYDVSGSNHNGASISAHYYVNGQATPGVPADGANKFFVSLESWREGASTTSPGSLNAYIYHPEQRDVWGDHFFPTGMVLPYSAVPGDFGDDFVARPEVVPERGRWYCYELMVRANTPGQRDGRIAIWIDGQVAADFTNLRLRDTPSLTIDRFALSLHARSSPRENKIWYDNVVAATSYIGPMAQ